jgi:hypothetical protein
MIHLLDLKVTFAVALLQCHSRARRRRASWLTIRLEEKAKQEMGEAGREPESRRSSTASVGRPRTGTSVGD